MAAARWLLPPPGGPNSKRLAPFSSQLSPAVSAMTWALLTIGTASKSKPASGWPTFLVGLFGELGPHQFDGRQAQVGEQQLDARSVDRIDRLHATPPSSPRSGFGARTA